MNCAMMTPICGICGTYLIRFEIVAVYRKHESLSSRLLSQDTCDSEAHPPESAQTESPFLTSVEWRGSLIRAFFVTRPKLQPRRPKMFNIFCARRLLMERSREVSA